MEALLILTIIIFIMLTSVKSFLSSNINKNRQEFNKKLFKALNFKIGEKNLLAGLPMVTVIDDIDVSINNRENNEVPGFKIHTKHFPIPGLDKKENIMITMETTSSQMKKIIGNNDILTGDKNFDDRILITCTSPPVVHALLSKEIRSKILLLISYADDIVIDHFKVYISIDESYYINDIEILIMIIKTMAFVSKSFTEMTNTKEAIIKNIKLETEGEEEKEEK